VKIFIELNKGFISCIHRASAHMQNYPYLCTGCKYKDACIHIFGTNQLSFLRGSIQFLGSALKFKVGRVSRITFFSWPNYRYGLYKEVKVEFPFYKLHGTLLPVISAT
jgi:hypothetical protein